MHTMDLLGPLLSDEAIAGMEPEPGICCFTGEECATLPRSKVLDKTFNKHQKMQAPNSERVGVNAVKTLDCKEQRMSCWVCKDGKFLTVGESREGKLKDLSRSEARDLIFSDSVSSGPWAGYFTTSYHKHGCFVSPVNVGTATRIWGFEDFTVDCTDVQKCREIFNDLMKLKFNEAMEFELESLRFTMKTTLKIGIQNTMKYREKLEPEKNSARYHFLMYLLYSQKEIKELGDSARERWGVL